MATKYYSDGYQAAAQAAGYTTNDAVRTLQRQLNSQGAGLAEDGIWGPKTDAAFRGSSPSTAATPTAQTSAQYAAEMKTLIGEKRSTPYANPYTEKLLTLIAPQEGTDYRRQAEAALRPELNRQLEDLNQAMAEEELQYDREKERLTQAAAEDRAQTESDYAARRGELETAALRRGLGRSTYLTDNLEQLAEAENRALATVDSDLRDSLKDTEEARALARSRYQQTAQRLQEDMMDDLAAYEAALREKDKSAAREAYATLLASYDAYERYRQQEVLDMLTTLYTRTATQEAAAAQAAAAAKRTVSKGKTEEKEEEKETEKKKEEKKKENAAATLRNIWEDAAVYFNHPQG